MCGVFAFIGPAAPNPDLLHDAAAAASTRGPHGHGWATAAGAHHELGPLDPAAVRHLTAPAIVGHARLATTGDYRDPAGLQPITEDGHHLAHNGTIRNWRELRPDAVTDTHALACLYAAARQTMPPVAALQAAMEQADTTAWALLLLDSTGVLLTWCRGLPLWRHTDPTGVYLSSRRFHPAAIRSADDMICEETPQHEHLPGP